MRILLQTPCSDDGLGWGEVAVDHICDGRLAGARAVRGDHAAAAAHVVFAGA